MQLNTKQKTLKNQVKIDGIGLHSGAMVSVVVKPAKVGAGITFKRVDVKTNNEIDALWHNVVDTRLCTVIGNEDDVSVATIEHLMAAFAGCEIDNALVEVNAPELPILDGSSEPFVKAILAAGIYEQPAERHVLKVLKPVEVRDANGWATLKPAKDFSVNLSIAYPGSDITNQSKAFSFTSEGFNRQVSAARTFCFSHEVEKMRSAGLAKGGSLENAIVVDESDGIMNEEGLRFDDEFVLHKILDCVGDLYLAGHQIIGQFEGAKTGHRYNNLILRELFKDSSNWCYEPPRPEMMGRVSLDHNFYDNL